MEIIKLSRKGGQYILQQDEKCIYKKDLPSYSAEYVLPLFQIVSFFCCPTIGRASSSLTRFIYVKI